MIAPAATQINYARLAVQCKALADPHRLHILDMLAASPATLSVEDIEANLIALHMPIKQPTISYHLGLLQHAGLVALDHHKGTYRYYRVRHETLAALCEALGGMR